MLGFDFFGKKKKEQAEAEELRRKQAAADEQRKKQAEAERLSKLQEGNLQASKDNTEIGKSLDSKSDRLVSIGESLDSKGGRLVSLVEETNTLKESLLSKEQDLSAKENELAEREKKIRQDEIGIVGRKTEVRNQESEARRQDKALDTERESIKKREEVAKKQVSDSQAAKKNAEEKKRKLDKKESNLSERESALAKQEKEIKTRIFDAEHKEKKAHGILENAEKASAELAEKERTLNERNEEIKRKLDEKIEEYDKKIASIDEVTRTVDSIKFDKSPEGKNVKIVVQEAIRKAKKELEDCAKTFEELQDKYCKGTFRGFATPIAEIEKNYADLRSQIEQIREHVESNELDNMAKIVETLEDWFLKATDCKKSWDFSECYRHICYGLAICRIYELLIEIVYSADDENAAEDNDSANEEPDYYKILGVPEDATKADIAKAYKQMAKKHHPDKGLEGDEEMMKKINAAKEILLNSNARKAYDKRRRKNR